MKYKLIENNKDYDNFLYTILSNRGIDNPLEYINVSQNDILSPRLLDNIDKGVKVLAKAIKDKVKIAILVDTDVDGYTSASIMYMFLKKIGVENVSYLLHQEAKTHGLSARDVFIDKEIGLLIIPDAGTNDFQECKELVEQFGMDILILDHHEKEVENPYAVIINNQCSDRYTNKALSGVGVVFQFLRYFNLQDLGLEHYNPINFIDLVALGLIGDVMDIRNYENKAICNIAIENMKMGRINPFFEALINKNNYSMNNVINIKNIQWVIVPQINAMIRVGSYEEKEMLFRAFIGEQEEFDFLKRDGTVVEENLQERVARLCSNEKGKQDRQKKKMVNTLVNGIEQECQNDKVIVYDATNVVTNDLTGLVASSLASKFSRPVILLHGREDKLGGSARNCKNSFVENLKDEVSSVNVLDFALGHQSAFGVMVDREKMELFKEKMNDKFRDIDVDKVYYVDFKLYDEDVNVALCNDIVRIKDYICSDIEEPLVYVEDVNVNLTNCNLMGKNQDSISYVNMNGVKYVFFTLDEKNEFLQAVRNKSNSTFILNIIGNPDVNYYQGLATPQFTVIDFEIVDKMEENNGWDTDEIEDLEDGWGESAW